MRSQTNISSQDATDLVPSRSSSPPQNLRLPVVIKQWPETQFSWQLCAVFLEKTNDPERPVPRLVCTGWLFHLLNTHATFKIPVVRKIPQAVLSTWLASHACSHQPADSGLMANNSQQEVFCEIMTDFFLPGVPICLPNPPLPQSLFRQPESWILSASRERCDRKKEEKTNFDVWTRLKYLRETFWGEVVLLSTHPVYP